MNFFMNSISACADTYRLGNEKIDYNTNVAIFYQQHLIASLFIKCKLMMNAQ